MSLRIVRVAPDLDLATYITSSGFVQPISDALRQDVDVHLKESQIVYSIFKDDVVVGFAIFKKIVLPAVFPACGSCLGLYEYLDLPVLYLAGIMLHESVQGQGIAEETVLHAKNEMDLSYFALRTQSLRMWIAGNKMTKSWYPNPTGSHSGRFDVAKMLLAKQLNMQLAKAHSSMGFYGAPLYGTKPVHRDTKLQTWWDSICSFERGDAVLCIGQFK